MSGEKQQEAVVVWEGDGLEVLRELPKAIKNELGYEIQRLQLGVKTL